MHMAVTMASWPAYYARASGFHLLAQFATRINLPHRSSAGITAAALLPTPSETASVVQQGHDIQVCTYRDRAGRRTACFRDKRSSKW